MKNVDTRVQFTKSALKNALLDILEDKPIGRVTIKELMDKAGLNRGTFYLHYNTPFDVLKEIEEEYVRDIKAVFDDVFTVTSDYGALTGIFEAIMENRKVSRVLFGINGDASFAKNFADECKDLAVSEWKTKSPGISREDLEFVYDFVFYGSTLMLVNWIDDDKGLSAERFGQRMERLGHYSQVAAAEFK